MAMFSEDLNPAKAALLIFVQRFFYQLYFNDQILLVPARRAVVLARPQQAVNHRPHPPVERDEAYSRRLRPLLIPSTLRRPPVSLERIDIEGLEERLALRSTENSQCD